MRVSERYSRNHDFPTIAVWPQRRLRIYYGEGKSSGSAIVEPFTKTRVFRYVWKGLQSFSGTKIKEDATQITFMDAKTYFQNGSFPKLSKHNLHDHLGNEPFILTVLFHHCHQINAPIAFPEPQPHG